MSRSFNSTVTSVFMCPEQPWDQIQDVLGGGKEKAFLLDLPVNSQQDTILICPLWKQTEDSQLLLSIGISTPDAGALVRMVAVVQREEQCGFVSLIRSVPWKTWNLPSLAPSRFANSLGVRRSPHSEVHPNHSASVLNDDRVSGIETPLAETNAQGASSIGGATRSQAPTVPWQLSTGRPCSIPEAMWTHTSLPGAE